MIVKKNNPPISVIMSVYNSEEYLSEAIESILNQNFENFEFIIIDDGSTDGSLEIINSYAAKDSRIKILSHENKGLPASLNEGIAIATGKYIVRMDADDISLPSRFQKQYQFLESNPEIGVCGSLALRMRKNSSKYVIFSHPEKHEALRLRLLFSVCFIHPTVMIRISVLDKLEYFYDEKFTNSQDYELWSRLVLKTRFYNLQVPLLLYRQTEDVITSRANNNGLAGRYWLVKAIQRAQVQRLGLDITERESIIHFRLGLNAEMPFSSRSDRFVKEYLDKLILANLKNRVFCPREFYIFISRKYFVYLILSTRRNKKILCLEMFSLMFLVGGFYNLKEKNKYEWVKENLFST